MQASRFILAAALAVALGVSGPAQANHEKGHHGGKGKMECPYKGKHKRGEGKPCPFSPEKQALLKGAMDKARGKNEALRKSMMKNHEAMKAVLSAKEFNKKAFLATFNKSAEARAAMMRNKAEAFADIAGQLTPEERKKAAMFVAMGGGMRHGGMMGRHHGGKHGNWGHHGRRHHDGGSDLSGPRGSSGNDWGSLNQ